jgi:hypothetical protein
VRYLESHKRCPVNIVARYESVGHAGFWSAEHNREHKFREKCGSWNFTTQFATTDVASRRLQVG